MASLHQVHMESLSFIAGTGSTRNHHVIESMAMLPQPEARAIQLRASVYDQLQRLNENTNLLKLSRLVPPPQNSVLYSLANGTDPLSMALKKLEIPAKLASRKWIEFHVCYCDGRTLQTFVLPSARVKSYSRIDACLLQDNETFGKALAWRRNVVWMNATCHCGRKFTRRHVNQCGFHPMINTTQTKQWLNQRGVQTSSYNMGDEFLNEKNYEKFLLLWDNVALINDNAEWDGPSESMDETPKERPSQAGFWKVDKFGTRIPTINFFAKSVAEWTKNIGVLKF